MGEIGRRGFEVHTDMGAGRIGAALVRHVYLMGPVVVVGAVVVHHDQHRDVILDRHPERAEVEHQIAVRLEIDHQPAISFMGQSDADGHADLRAGAELASRVAVGLVEIPYLVDPFFQCVGGEHPILVLYDLPYLVGEAGFGHWPLVPLLLYLILPFLPLARVSFADRLFTFLDA